ncbi:hypothetical protein ADK60_16590 [Streptomyces sp. XY431]|nr:hypothetical protein ADK60_16590 [Streptomyces sp. XY431]
MTTLPGAVLAVVVFQTAWPPSSYCTRLPSFWWTSRSSPLPETSESPGSRQLRQSMWSQPRGLRTQSHSRSTSADALVAVPRPMTPARAVAAVTSATSRLGGLPVSTPNLPTGR